MEIITEKIVIEDPIVVWEPTSFFVQWDRIEDNFNHRKGEQQ